MSHLSSNRLIRAAWRPLSLMAACVFACSSQALAAPGDHIRAGETTITPDIDLGFEYHTNAYRADSTEDTVGGGNLLVSPGIDITLDTPQNEFVLASEWQVHKYLFVGQTEEHQASGLTVPAANLDRFNDFNISAGLDALKQEVVGLKLHEQASLRNNQADAIGYATPFTTQIRNAMGGGLRVSPGPALDIVVGADWAYDDFRMSGSQVSRERFNMRNTYGPTLDVKWDFFPRTSLVLQGDYMLHRWGDNSIAGTNGTTGTGTGTTGTTGAGGNDVSEDVLLPNSNHIKVQTGIEGRFTKKAFLDLMIGYGSAVYDETTVDAALLASSANAAAADLKGLDGLLATVQVRYKIADEAQFSLGYRKDFADSFFTNYVAYNQVYAQLTANVADLHPMAKYSVRFENYSGDVLRTDLLNRFEVGASYDLQEWASLSTGVSWQQRAVAEPLYDSVEYDDVVVNFMSTFTY